MKLKYKNLIITLIITLTLKTLLMIITLTMKAFYMIIITENKYIQI